jgi:hypothetical protein
MENTFIKNKLNHAEEIENILIKTFHNLDNNPRKDYLV